MKEVPEQLRKLRRQYLRYQQAEIIYSISHKKVFELASDAGAIYRIDGTVLINSIRLNEWWVAESLKQIQIFIDTLSATCRLPVYEITKTDCESLATCN